MISHDFLTSNTSLAAYLIASDFTLQRIQFDGQFGIFIFAPEPDIAAFVELFKSGEAEGNINHYQAARDELISEIKRGQQP